MAMLIGLLVAGMLLAGGSGFAQQVQITTPYHTLNDSFYENFGVGWGLAPNPNRNFYFSGIPSNSTPPPFGGYDPSADARLGFRIGPFNFDMLAGQGNNRSHVMQAPTVVIPNGGTGYFSDTSQRPFVTGVVPVVGNALMAPAMPMPAPYVTSPLQQRLEQLQWERERLAAGAEEDAAVGGRGVGAELPAAPEAAPLVIKRGEVQRAAPSDGGTAGSATSTANHGDLSLAEIRRQQAAEDAAARDELETLIEKAHAKEQLGNLGLAKIYYQQAASRAEGELKQQLLQKIRSLGD
jgi:hypothetical protein